MEQSKSRRFSVCVLGFRYVLPHNFYYRPYNFFNYLRSELPLLHPPFTREHPSQGRNNAPPHNGASTNIGISNDMGSLDSLSFAHTSTSSITSLPSFVIDMYKLVRLSSLAPSSEHVANLPRRINVLVAVLEVDGPNSVVLKKVPKRRVPARRGRERMIRVGGVKQLEERLIVKREMGTECSSMSPH